jgi:hypothetical protein
MKKINYFDRSPDGGWLHRMHLKVGELVLVGTRVFRYSTERQGLDHVLTPVEPQRGGK